jgi:hypothetical protein
MSDDAPQKPERDELINDISEYLVGYIGEGISIKPALSDFTPNTDINNLKELLEYYFLLTGEEVLSDNPPRSNLTIGNTPRTDIHGNSIGVRDFVTLLASRARSLDIEVKTTTEIYRGEAPGRIDWNETIKHRYSSGDLTKQTFACQTQQPTIKSARNKILVELLTTIEDIYTRFDNQVAGDNPPQWFYPWLKEHDRTPLQELQKQATAIGDVNLPDGTEELPDLRSLVNTTLNQTRLSNLETKSIAISDTEIRQVRSERTSLYREAAELLSMYRRLMREDLDMDLAKSILGSMLIQPPDGDQELSTLYELYWILRILDTHNGAKRNLFSMSPDEDLIARWTENGATYLLFNDWDGTYNGQEYLHFNTPAAEDLSPHTEAFDEEQDSTDLSEREDLNLRIQNVLSNRYRLETSVLDYSPDRKTPDIVLVKLLDSGDTPQIESVLVGEVKHSLDTSYLRDGLQQLLEYGAFVKIGEDAEFHTGADKPFLASDPSVIGSPGLELGYFVGLQDILKNAGPNGIHIVGFGQEAQRII